MKKRVLSLLILLVILLGNIVPLTSYAVDTTTSVEIVNPEGGEVLVEPGDTFSLDIMFNNPVSGAKALSGFLKYDDTKLEIQGAVDKGDGSYMLKKGEDIGDFLNSISYTADDPSMVNFTHVNTFDNILKAGKCFTITFKVKEGATGTFDISFSEVKYVTGESDDTEFPINKGNKLTGKIRTPLQSISIKNATTLGVGNEETLDVTYTPANTTDVKQVTWSSNRPEIARVGATDGKITAVAPGTAVITATSKANNQITATCTVTVTSKLTKITLNKSEIEMAKDQTEDLTVTYIPANTTDSKKITWTSSQSTVAKVESNEDGKATVTALSLGETIITAKSQVDGVPVATCKVNVTSKLQKIILSDTNIELDKGDSKKLTVSYIPADTTDDTTVTWKSSNNLVATVDEDGNIQAVAPGTATITVTSKVPNVKPVTATVRVVSHLTEIEIEGGNIEKLLPKQSKTLKVKFIPEDTTDSRTITWSSTPSDVVSVDSTGKITALKPGTATIKAKCGDVEDEISVEVPVVHITTIAFKEPELDINKNQIVKAEIIYLPENTTDAKTVTFESKNPEFATVDNDGNIKGIAAGTATIVAKSSVPGVADAICTVNVKVPLTGITLNKQKVTLNKGNRDTLQVILNELDTTDNTTVAWSSLNSNVVEVKPDGTITAKSAGTAIIRAQVGSHTADCQVTVKVPLKEIKIKDTTKLYKGLSETLTVEYNPGDTTDNKDVTWTSDDVTVATVDSNGKITAKKAGTAIIKAQVGEFIATCKVTVEEINLESVAIDNKIDSLLKGEEYKLKVKYLPENTTDEKVVKWSSSDESIVTVDENGLVKGLKAGKATITIQNGDMKDSFEIEIKEVEITGIEVTNENKTLKPGDTLQLTVDFLPGNTTESRELLYSSSDEDVITVDENGVVRALRTGKAVITVTASNEVQTQIELSVEAEVITEEQAAKEEVKLSALSPATGDINIALYISLMIISLAGIIIAIKTKK